MQGPNATWTTFRSFSRDRGVTAQRLRPGTLRRIAAHARPHLRRLVVFLALTALGGGIVVATPLLMKAVIDEGVVPGEVGRVAWLAAALAGLALVEAVLTLVQRWYSARIGEGLIYDLRTRVFRHVQRMSMAFFTRTQTGALVSRLNTDVIGAQRALTTTLSSLVSNAVSLVLVLAAMLALSWQITLLVLALLPLFILPAKAFGRRLAGITRERMSLDAEMSSLMTERFGVGGAMLVKLYGRPEEEAAEFAARAARVRDIGVTSAMYSRVFFTGLTLVAALATALVYGVGGWLAIGEGLELGTLVALATLLTRLYGPLTALSNVHVDVMTALVSFDRVFEVLDLEPAVTERPDARPLPAGPVGVELDDVSFRYPRPSEVAPASLESTAAVLAGDGGAAAGAWVLEGVSLRAEPGEMVALVGPSGAGKTTLTHLVTRLYDPVEGAVRIGGVDLRAATAASLRDTVGVVTQDAHLFHDTVAANLRYARPGAGDGELLDALRAARLEHLLSELPDGLDTVVGDRGYRLSGGERQRLAIARLLLKAPAVVVLDEATAHLDSGSEAAVQEALAAALRGRTSLVIAHRLSTVREADRILVLDGGRIVERGRHEELLAAGGLYAHLYRTQFASQERGATGVV
ncbi:ABC transporter ATP-binding protein [Marinitenerispora sediminis]|uniref:ABC transporter n=1 Tax=Marinitenerispora sediminis TaxID=1931232 RepID=A0A368T030_9ACTN|nr:ABC transporter ATP-binding protein [Marinitenerispora sediminis]RCV48287.1 ABC transporter [Marinitenerispora sediminis]RCV49458.1 ABC transporter [Marinitenerispora sediminis]RCV52221.1 ABC transporter [Marinitenerispora sediminis]